MNDGGLVLTIEDQYLNVLVSAVLPLVVAFVTKRFANATVRGLILLLLSAITGCLTQIQAAGGTFELKAAVVYVAISFITAVAAHSGVLNGAVTGDSGPILRALPGGVGPVDYKKKVAYQAADRQAA